MADAIAAQSEPFRADACSRAWAAPRAATNSYEVAMARYAPEAARLPRVSRRGGAPMLRALRDRSELPGLLADLGLAHGAWAELGVLQGAFSRLLLASSNATLHLVDLWAEVDIYQARFGRENLAATREAVAAFGARAVFHVNTTSNASREFADASLDFVYLDATHTYADSARDLRDWWPKLKVGGLMAGDDYFTGFVPKAGYTFGVRDAVDEFFGRADHRVYATKHSDVDAAGLAMPQWYVLKCRGHGADTAARGPPPWSQQQ